MSETIFDFLIEAPAETYPDHLVLSGGWMTEFEPQEQERTPWIAHGMNAYHIEVEIYYWTRFVKRAFEYFGGSNVSRVITFSSEELEDYFYDGDNQEDASVHGFRGDLDHLVKAADRYLTGRCTSYECKELIEYPD